MKLFDLTGRVAVVTGGNGGIGLGMARGLARAGAAVVVAARNPTKNAAALTELEARWGRSLLEAWERGESSLRVPLGEPAAA